MSKFIRIGSTYIHRIECWRCVNGIGELFDPTTLKVSFLLPDGTEDTLTFNGTDIRDDQLIRVSLGVYEANYVLSMLGRWSISASLTDVVDGKTWPTKQQRPALAFVEADTHSYADISIAP